MTNKTYTNVSKMIRGISDDRGLAESVDEALDRQRVIRQLMSLRAARGMSQSDLAKAMGCSQSKISKLESSEDSEVQFGDLQQYAGAVEGDLCTAVRRREMEPAEEIKCLSMVVRQKLIRMAELANQDEQIATGVTQFVMEAMFNFNLIVAQVASVLPKNADGSPRIAINVKVEHSVEEAEEEEADVKTKLKVKKLTGAR